jgi:hypothetical protein
VNSRINIKIPIENKNRGAYRSSSEITGLMEKNIGFARKITEFEAAEGEESPKRKPMV